MSINIHLKDHRCTIQSLTLLIAFIICQFGIFWLTKPAKANFYRDHFYTRCDGSEKMDVPGECIWGHVYYQGRPIEGAEVILKFQEQIVSILTQVYPGDSVPYYRIRLPVQNGDLLNITAKFAKQSVTQSITIGADLPIENGFMLGLATRGQWKPWHLKIEKTNVLYPNNEILLAGSSEGLSIIADNILSRMAHINQSQFDSLWQKNGNDTVVQDIEIDMWGRIWVVGKRDIFVWQEKNHWKRIENPDDPHWADVEWQTLIQDQKSKTIWVGGKRDLANSEIGHLASYDSQTKEWTVYDPLDAPITALTIDSNQEIWVGTWGAGVYHRRADGEWTHFLFEDGLPSDYIYTIYAQPSFFTNNSSYESIPAALWVGTGANGRSSQGGIGYYTLADKSWRTYNKEQGLPTTTRVSTANGQIKEQQTGKSQDSIGNITADVYTFLMTDDGLLWAGTEIGLYIFGNNNTDEEHWVLHDKSLQEEVRALTFFDNNIIAAMPENLHRLTPTLFKDERPSISILPSQRGDVMSAENQLPSYINEADIVAWQWESDLDGLLCTTRHTCPLDNLSFGNHQLTLRLQTRYGTWIPPLTTHLTLGHTIYLPWFQRTISGK